MVPILDMQFKVVNSKIVYHFYKKPCSSPYTILKRSAISDSTKRISIFQECYRRLTNTSRNVPDQVLIYILSDFSNMLRLSGYSEAFRMNTINGALLRWREVLSLVDKGDRVLHRSQDQIANQKKEKGGGNPATWFLRNQTTSTIGVPYTPSGMLKNNVQKELNKIRGPDGG